MAPHPYFPLGLALPGYVPPVLGMETILGVFFSIVGALMLAAWALSASLRTSERCLCVWMLACAAIHLVVEGAFSLNGTFYQNSDPNMLLLELWKEYSKADSRYATRDSFVVTMETVTAFVCGPCCFLVFVGMLNKSAWRWSLLLVVSVAQLYGDVLYFATCWFEGAIHSRPEFLYFWFYFIFMNAIWIVIPLLCVYYSFQRINASTALADAKPKLKVK